MIAVTIHLRRCPQHYGYVAYPAGFIGKRGKPVNFCKGCQERYSGWETKTPEERAAASAGRKGVPRTTVLRARLFVKSQNTKLGGIPSSMTSRGTCPTTCSFYEHGCMSEYGKIAYHWRTVGESGDTWEKFCADVAALPEGQLWRHNVAGDLPGDGVTIDRDALEDLVHANRDKRGFTFTHHSYTNGPDIETVLHNESAIRYANRNGFTVNISCDSLEQADRVARFQKVDGAVPVVVVVPHDAPIRLKTPEGRRVTICPAETEAGMTCADCRLCADANRKTIVAFQSHGQSRAQVDRLVQLRRTA